MGVMGAPLRFLLGTMVVYDVGVLHFFVEFHSGHVTSEYKRVSVSRRWKANTFFKELGREVYMGSHEKEELAAEV